MKAVIVLALIMVVSGCTAIPVDSTGTASEPNIPTESITNTTPEPPANTTVPDNATEVTENATTLPEPSTESTTLTIKLREEKNVTLAGISHSVTYLGSDTVLEAAIHVNFYGNNLLKDKQLNFTTNGRKLGVTMTNVTFGRIATDMTATFTLTDLGPAEVL